MTPPMMAPRLFEVEFVVDVDLATFRSEEDGVGLPTKIVLELWLELIPVLELVVVVIVVPVDSCDSVPEVCGATEVVAVEPWVGVVFSTVTVCEVEAIVFESAPLVVAVRGAALEVTTLAVLALVVVALVVVAFVVSENVSAATSNCDVNVTPTGSLTPDAPGVGTSSAWHATGNVVSFGASFERMYG